MSDHPRKHPLPRAVGRRRPADAWGAFRLGSQLGRPPARNPLNHRPFHAGCRELEQKVQNVVAAPSLSWHRASIAVLVAVVGVGIGVPGATTAAGEGQERRWSPGRRDLVGDAEETWRQGIAYFPEGSSGGLKETFEAIDGGVRAYLRRERHARAEWSTAVVGDPDLLVLDEALTSGDALRQLHALVVLMRSRTSANVETQWRVLEGLLGRRSLRARERDLLILLREEFGARSVSSTLQRALEARSQAATDEVLWAMRAAGIAGTEEMVSLLQRLSRSGDGDILMTALVALARAHNWAAFSALLGIVKEGRRPFAIRAAVVLGADAPEVLRVALREDALSNVTRDRVLIGLASGGDRSVLAEIARRLPDMENAEVLASLDVIAAIARVEDVPLLESAAGRLEPERAKRILDLVDRLKG